MAQDKVTVEISIEEREALKALNKLSRGVESFEKDAVTSVKKTDRAFDSFKGNLTAIAASGAIRAIGSGLQQLVVGSLDAARATEKIQTQLEVLTGSQEKAADLFQELTEFSASTPFQLQGIAEASAQLLSFGFEASTVQERIAKIGEVAAGSGSDLKEVALIYGQVAAAGKLTGERLLQLQERAVPIGAALANSLGVAESEVKDLVSSGVVGFSEFEEAFNSLSESGGLFEGAINKQSQTINGVLSTLGDNFFILQAQIGEAFAPSLIDGAKVITQSLQDLTQILIENRDVIDGSIKFLSDYISFYSFLAGEIVKTETPLSSLNEKIEENVEATQKLLERRKELESNKGDFFGIFDANTQLGIDKINSLLGEQDGKLKELIETRKQLINAERTPQSDSTESDNAAIDAKIQKEKEVSAQIIQERRDLNNQLQIIEAEKLAKEQESKLAQKELQLEDRELSIQSLRDFEIRKADAQLQVEMEKNSKIRDEKSKALADEIANQKRSIAVQQAQAKAEQNITNARVQNQQLLVSGFARATQQAASIAKQGTKEQKALAISSAVINTYQAGTRAYKDYPYPANLAVLATTIASGLNQVSQIQRQSFQTGGVVGGFNGATNGTDNTTVNARSGELILNANQQRRLFDIADGNASQESSPTNLEITSIVQVDEREIARAVRNQRLEGFSI